MGSSISPNARRWLDMISYAEGTWGGSAPRYDITFGYRPIKDLSKHPNQVVQGGKYSSAAAGAYQFMPGTWSGVAKQQGLKDFGPVSQDLAALALIRAKGVDPEKDPITPQTVAKLAGTWASLPTLQGKSAYGQPVKSFEALKQFAAKRGAAAQASTASQASTAKDTQASGLSLLNKFIDILGTTGALRQFGPQSSLPAPALPDYNEGGSAEAAPEAEMLLNLYADRQKQKDVYKDVEEQAGLELQRNLAAAEQARSQLIAEALSSFTNPQSVI